MPENEVCVENYLYDTDTETWDWEGDCKVLVEEEMPGAEWALRASASVYWWVAEIHTHEVVVRNETPAPFEGLESTTVSAEALGAEASIEAQFMTPVGEVVQQANVHVVNISATSSSPPIKNADNILISTVGSGVVFQETIELVGAKLPDGTEVYDGTLPCHLEVSGGFDISGPLTPDATGWGVSHASYVMRLFAAPVPDGFSLVPPLYGRMEYPAAGIPVHIFDAGLERLTELWVAWGDSTHGVPPVPPAGVSSSFAMPIGGRVVLYNDKMQFSVTNGDDVRSMSMSIAVDFKLVPDQPGVTLIYRK